MVFDVAGTSIFTVTVVSDAQYSIRVGDMDALALASGVTLASRETLLAAEEQTDSSVPGSSSAELVQCQVASTVFRLSSGASQLPLSTFVLR